MIICTKIFFIYVRENRRPKGAYFRTSSLVILSSSLVISGAESRVSEAEAISAKLPFKLTALSADGVPTVGRYSRRERGIFHGSEGISITSHFHPNTTYYGEATRRPKGAEQPAAGDQPRRLGAAGGTLVEFQFSQKINSRIIPGTNHRFEE